MSFWKIIGEIAKDAATDYVADRGVKGITEDVSGLAKGMKDFFSSNNQDDNNWVDVYSDMIENKQFEQAVEYVEEIWGDDKDYSYYFLVANAFHEGYVSTGDTNMLERATSAIGRARCPKNDELYEDIQELSQAISASNASEANINDWNEMSDKIEALKSEGHYEEAIKTLDTHYRLFEDNIKDFYYWRDLFNIMVDKIADNNFDLTDFKNTCEKCIREAEKLKNPDIQSEDEELETMKTTWLDIQSISKFHDAMTGVRNMINQHMYDKAEKSLNDYYASNNEEYDFNYWQMMFDILTFPVKEGKCKLNEKAVEDCILQAAIKADDESAKNRITEMRTQFQALKDNSGNSDTAGKTGACTYEDNEKEYVDEIKACLADDGIITERERRLLDKLRKSLGISEERATELEKLADSKTLSQEEQEYADEIKACLADDGVITARERRLLDRLRNSLGISEERANEIENQINK